MSEISQSERRSAGAVLNALNGASAPADESGRGFIMLRSLIIVALLLIHTTAVSAQDEQDFTFDAGTGAEGDSSSLFDNLRLNVDIIGRYDTSREDGRPEWLFAAGLDLHNVFSDADGDIGTLLLQPYAVYRRNARPLMTHVDDENGWEFEAHDFYFNLTRFGQGRTNIKVGHFDLPFGLEPSVNTHFTVQQLIPIQNLGTKKDWGVSLNGMLPEFDYEVSLTRGSGVEYVDKGDNYVVAGRIGTPAEENLVVGVSGMYAEIIQPMAVMRYRMGLPMMERMMFRPADNIVRRTRFGVDVSWITGAFTIRGEASVGRDFDQDVFTAIAELNWTNPEETLTAYVQGIYLGQRGSMGWDEDIIGRIGVLWHFHEQWSLSGQISHDFSAYQMRTDDTVFTAQLRWSF